MPATVDLLDANLWLALAHENYVHNTRALRYWESEGLPAAALCRVTQMAFLRLLTNKTIMRAEVLSPSDAWTKCQQFLALREVRFFNEPSELEAQWGSFSNLGRTSQNLWTDSYLAAFAKCAGLRLVTFDQAFTQFPGLEVLTLAPDISVSAPRRTE